MSANAISVLAEKVCSRCGETKPTSEYHRKGTRLHSTCKACVSLEKKIVYKRQKRSHIPKGIRQIQLDGLQIITTIYSGDLPNPTNDEQLNLLRSFVLEDVICNEN